MRESLGREPRWNAERRAHPLPTLPRLRGRVGRGCAPRPKRGRVATPARVARSKQMRFSAFRFLLFVSSLRANASARSGRPDDRLREAIQSPPPHPPPLAGEGKGGGLLRRSAPRNDEIGNGVWHNSGATKTRRENRCTYPPPRSGGGGPPGARVSERRVVEGASDSTHRFRCKRFVAARAPPTALRAVLPPRYRGAG